MSRDFFKAAKDAHGSAPQFGKAEKTKTKKSPKGTKAPPPKSGDEKFEAWENKVKRKVGDRKPMANKFLPFIVEKSAPLHIYQTLLSRSKGMNTNLVTSIFCLVIQKGIKEVRAYVKTLADMQLEKLYEDLVIHFPECKIDDDELQLFLGLENYLTSDDIDQWDENLNEFDVKDILAFLLVMTKLNMEEEFTNLKFKSIYLEGTREGALHNIQSYHLFSDSAPVTVTFENPDHLKFYILFHIFLREEQPTVCAKFAPSESQS